MATSYLSGYLAEAQTVAFSGTQTMDSLAVDEWTNLSDEIDNSTNKYMLADFELVLGSAAFVDDVISMYIVPSVDGTNYPDWTGNVATAQSKNEQYFVGSFSIDDTQAQRAALRGVALPNGKFKIGIRNNPDVALAASGNTLKYRPYGYGAS